MGKTASKKAATACSDLGAFLSEPDEESAMQVLERAEGIEPGASWHGVFTNNPPTKTEETLPLAPAGPRAFYRLRALGR